MSACVSTPRVTSVVYEDLYDLDPEFGHEVFVRQVQPDSAYVYFRIRTGHLLHKRKNADAPFKVRAGFDVLMIPYGSSSVDTLKYHLEQEYPDRADELVYGRFTVPMSDTTAYEARIFLTDELSGKVREYNRFYTTTGDDERYNHMLINGRPSRYCACEPGDAITFFPYGWTNGAVDWNFYTIESAPAPPPFSINSPSAPKTSLVDEGVLNYDGGISFSCPGDGVLQLVDEELNSMLEIPVFSEAFPSFSSYAELTEPLRFISTSKEYAEMAQAEDKQSAFEEFWIECGGSKERARILIEEYYSRVLEANHFYTRMTPGWKTDRGLMHVVYGPPIHIMRYPDREMWFYGTDRSESSLKLLFYYQNGKYILDRSLDYRQSWYLTVDSWRNGRTINP